MTDSDTPAWFAAFTADAAKPYTLADAREALAELAERAATNAVGHLTRVEPADLTAAYCAARLTGDATPADWCPFSRATRAAAGDSLAGKLGEAERVTRAWLVEAAADRPWILARLADGANVAADWHATRPAYRVTWLALAVSLRALAATGRADTRGMGGLALGDRVARERLADAACEFTDGERIPAPMAERLARALFDAEPGDTLATPLAELARALVGHARGGDLAPIVGAVSRLDVSSLRRAADIVGATRPGLGSSATLAPSLAPLAALLDAERAYRLSRAVTGLGAVAYAPRKPLAELADALQTRGHFDAPGVYALGVSLDALAHDTGADWRESFRAARASLGWLAANGQADALADIRNLAAGIDGLGRLADAVADYADAALPVGRQGVTA